MIRISEPSGTPTGEPPAHRVRWLDLSRPIVYVGRADAMRRGQRCQVVAGPSLRRPTNMLVRFADGESAVAPIGTLRNAPVGAAR